MFKKTISLMLAVFMIVSCTVCADAAETNCEPSKASGTFFFDPTTWGTKYTVCFYIWDKEAKQFASKTGWMDDNTWGSKKKTGVEASNGLYESYEIDLTGRENHHVYLILLNHATGDQTYDYQIDSSIFGKTCRFTGEHLEGPSDDPKTEHITFDAPGNTNKSQIGDVDSSGTIDSADSLFILRASVNLETLNDAQKQLADVDEDGSVTSADSLEVLRYSVKIPSDTKIGKFI